MALTIIITGAEKRQLTFEMTEKLKSAGSVILHTERCGCAEWLSENGIAYEALDSLYESVYDFDEHAAAVRDYVLSKPDACYCVMTERDESAREILRAQPGTAVIGPLTARATAPVTSFSALDIDAAVISPLNSAYVYEIDTRVSASEVKLRLMDIYGDEAKAYVRKPDGGEAYLPLENLDRLKSYDHRCCCLVNPAQAHADFETLLRREREKMCENEPESPEAIAKKLADVVRCICAAEAFGEATAQEIFDTAMEEIDYEP